jgi:2-dehydropantoate 2-reductase
VIEIAAALHPEAVIVLLQNGMGVGDLIKPLAPGHATLLQAITTEGVWRRSAFELVHAGRGHTWIGSGGAEYPIATAIAQQWRQAGVPASAEADIAPRLWRKLAVNCAINPFTALYRCRNGELPSHPDWLQGRERVLDEIIALAAVSGYASALEDIGREVDRVVAATAENQSSMLQDIRAGRSTEIEFMNGFVAVRSTAAGLFAAENQALAEAVRLLAASD